MARPLGCVESYQVAGAGSGGGEGGAGDHNRHLNVLAGLPITLSATAGRQGSELVNLGNKAPVLGIRPRQPYLLLALCVLGFLPA